VKNEREKRKTVYRNLSVLARETTVLQYSLYKGGLVAQSTNTP